MERWNITILILLLCLPIIAQDEGAVRYNSGSSYYEFYDGSQWLSLDNGTTGNACTETAAIQYNTTDNRLEFCNGSFWHSLMGYDTTTGCSVAGQYYYDSTGNKYEMCNGTTLWGNGGPHLEITTATQSITARRCSGVVTVQTNNTSGAATNVGSDLTVNLTAATGLTYYSDQYCANAVTSVTVLNGTSSANFYWRQTNTGTHTIAVTAIGYSGDSQDQTLVTNPFVWNGGGGDSDWTTGLNWTGGSAPGATDIAVFDDLCSANCSPSLSTNPSLHSIEVYTGYTGTITLNSNTLTLSDDYIQSGGTLSMTAGDFDIKRFYLMGGTYTAPSGQLYIYRGYAGWHGTLFEGFTVGSGATFNHNNGEVYTYGTNQGQSRTLFEFDVDGNVNFYDLRMRTSDGDRQNVIGTDTITVLNNLYMVDGYWETGSEIILQGDLYLSCSATCSEWSEATLRFNSGGTQTYHVEASGAEAPWFFIENGTTVVPANGNDFMTGGLNIVSGSFTAPTGQLTVFNGTWSWYSDNPDGMYIATGQTFNHNNGTLSLRGNTRGYSGHVGFNLDVVDGLTVNNLIIDISNSNTTPYQAGSVDFNNGTMTVLGDMTIDSGWLERGTYNLHGNFDALCASQPSNCAVYGNYDDQISNAIIDFVGTSAQTYNWADGSMGPRFKINNSNGVTPHASGAGTFTVTSLEVSAGSFTAPSTTLVVGMRMIGMTTEGLAINGTGSFSHNNGTLRYKPTYRRSTPLKISEINLSSTLQLYDLEIEIQDWSSSGGYDDCYADMTGTIDVVNNLTLIDGYINGGTINVQGNLSTSGTDITDGTLQLGFTGTGAQTIDNTAGADLPNGNVTVNKSSGTLTFLSNIDLEGGSQNFTITNGTVDMAGYTFNVGNVLTIGTGTTLTQNGGTLTYGSLVNNGTLNP